jgi:uncharacterized tellurite resistance protein B-like protein
MSLLRFLGLAPSREALSEPETVRLIAAKLDKLPPDEARKLAAFAYILARVANADLNVGEDEVARMEQLVAEAAQLTPGAAALAVQIARSQERLFGGTESYVVTREYRRLASIEERRALLRCLFAVASADDLITTDESHAIFGIAEELGIERAAVIALRGEFRDKLAELRGLR